MYYVLRLDMGDEKISSFAWGGAYMPIAHTSSLDKFFSKISHKQKELIFLKQVRITTVAPFRNENSDFLMK